MPAADRVPLDQLSRILDKAVELAGERQRITGELLRRPFGAEAVRPPRWIFGRIVRPDELGQAQQFAKDVIAQVAGETGLAGFESAVLILGDDILAGFIERFGQIDTPGRF